MAGKKKKDKSEDGITQVVGNKRAFHDYCIDEKFEAGLVLLGTEIKSVRDKAVSIKEGFIKVEGGEAWLMSVQINPYENARIQHEPLRRRKLLLKRREIGKLERGVEQKGFTIVPLRMYIRNNVAKIEIALAHGKAKFDKRDAIKERDSKREIDRVVKSRNLRD